MSVAIIARVVTGDVRKLLILRGDGAYLPLSVVNRHPGEAFIQGMEKIVDAPRLL